MVCYQNVFSYRFLEKDELFYQLTTVKKDQKDFSTGEINASVKKHEFLSTLYQRSIEIIKKLDISEQNLDIKQHNMTSKVMITLFSLFSELERDLISLRTKEALASKKAQGIQLGKPKGTVQKSKFDQHAPKIKELLDLGLSVRKIATFLRYTNHIGLNTYIKKRKMRGLIFQRQLLMEVEVFDVIKLQDKHYL